MRTPALIAVCLFALAVFSAAQSAPPSHGILSDPEAFADKHIAALDVQLHLTSDQKAKLRPIFTNELMKVQIVIAGSDSVEERQEQIGKIHAETHDRVSAVLTPEQQKRFDEMQPQPLPEPRPGTARI
jgi:Spy/CpxP family protein refolding chaperone